MESSTKIVMKKTSIPFGNLYFLMISGEAKSAEVNYFARDHFILEVNFGILAKTRAGQIHVQHLQID